MSQALERFKEDRGTLVERQAGEWGKIREAWKQIGREKVPERGRNVVQERKREADVDQGSRFGWLNRHAEERRALVRSDAELQQRAEQEEKKPSKFDWLNQQKDIPMNVREGDSLIIRRQNQDRDR